MEAEIGLRDVLYGAKFKAEVIPTGRQNIFAYLRNAEGEEVSIELETEDARMIVGILCEQIDKLETAKETT